MPFKKVGNKYVSPSGRKYTAAQVRLYYAQGGHFPGEKPESSRKTPAKKVRNKR